MFRIALGWKEVIEDEGNCIYAKDTDLDSKSFLDRGKGLINRSSSRHALSSSTSAAWVFRDSRRIWFLPNIPKLVVLAIDCLFAE